MPHVAACAASGASSPARSAVAEWYVMTRTNTVDVLVRSKQFVTATRTTPCAPIITPEEHPGNAGVRLCEGNFGTEMYVWYGTNEYNFEKLVNPRTLHRPSAWIVERSSIWAKAAFPMVQRVTGAIAAHKRSFTRESGICPE